MHDRITAAMDVRMLQARFWKSDRVLHLQRPRMVTVPRHKFGYPVLLQGKQYCTQTFGLVLYAEVTPTAATWTLFRYTVRIQGEALAIALLSCQTKLILLYMSKIILHT